VGGLRDAVEALRAEWRLDFRVARRVLAALGDGGSVAAVVAQTAADRHDVEEILRRVEPWVWRDGERYVLAARDGELPGEPGLDEPALARVLGGIAAELPPPARGLDHVLARPAATEASPTRLPQSIVDDVAAVLGNRSVDYLGPGWPAGTHDRPATDLADFLTGQRAHRTALAVNLHPQLGPLLPQALLAAAQQELAVIVALTAAARAAAAGPVWTFLRGANIEIRPAGRDSARDGGNGGRDDPEASLVVVRRRVARPATRVADQTAPVDQVYGFLAGHPQSRVGNAWRDALVALAAARGETMTKNEARMLIRSAGPPEPALQLRLGELPQETLDALVTAVAETVRSSVPSTTGSLSNLR
jgi:hypothetical protein